MTDLMSGTSSIFRLRQIAGDLCGGHYEPKSDKHAKDGDDLLELAEYLEVAIAQAVDFAEYVEVHAKGKMVDAAQQFLSLAFAEQLRRELVRARCLTKEELSDTEFHDRLYGMKFVYYPDPDNTDMPSVTLHLGMTTRGAEGDTAYFHKQDGTAK